MIVQERMTNPNLLKKVKILNFVVVCLVLKVCAQLVHLFSTIFYSYKIIEKMEKVMGTECLVKTALSI
jgi:hypothetical protein